MSTEATALTKTDTKRLETLAGEIGQTKASLVEGVLAIGAKLSEAHEILSVKGEFTEWVEQNCGFSRRTAYHYLEAFKAFGSRATLAHATRFDLTAIYALSNNEEARELALDYAKRGNIVTEAKAKEFIAEAAQAAEPEEESPAVTPPSIPSTSGHGIKCCPNCGGTEFDDDGDCVACFEPAAEAAPDDADDEPEPATKPTKPAEPNSIGEAIDTLVCYVNAWLAAAELSPAHQLAVKEGVAAKLTS